MQMFSTFWPESYAQNALILATGQHFKWGNYSQIDIKFINQDLLISRISQSILNQLPYNFTHTMFHLCRHYLKNFAKLR